MLGSAHDRCSEEKRICGVLAAFKNVPALSNQDCEEVRLCHYAAPFYSGGRSIQRRSLRTTSAVSATWNFCAPPVISVCRVTQKPAEIAKEASDNDLWK